MFSSVSSSLFLSISRAGISRQVQAALICEYFKQALKKITKIKNTEAVSFSNGVLIAKVPSPIYASELRSSLEKIRQEINNQLKNKMVERINIVVG